MRTIARAELPVLPASFRTVVRRQVNIDLLPPFAVVCLAGLLVTLLAY